MSDLGGPFPQGRVPSHPCSILPGFKRHGKQQLSLERGSSLRPGIESRRETSVLRLHKENAWKAKAVVGLGQNSASAAATCLIQGK